VLWFPSLVLAQAGSLNITTDFSKPISKAADITWDCPDAVSINLVMPPSKDALRVGNGAAAVSVGDAFVRDVLCETKSIVISIDGKGYRANGRGTETEFKNGFRRSYGNTDQDLTVQIKPIKTLDTLRDKDTQCTETKRLVEVTVRLKGTEKTVQGGVIGGCP
jgi:hypothetical protein